jgi:hypothetical protein
MDEKMNMTPGFQNKPGINMAPVVQDKVNIINMTPGIQDKMCACKPPMPSQMALAMAYVPVQCWETPYDVMTGVDRGTLFPGLDKPFLGKEAIRL